MTAEQIAPVPPNAVTAGPIAVTPRKGSKLEQLHALYYQLQAEKVEAEKRFKAVCDAIKLEVTQTDPNGRRFELVSKAGDALPLRVTYTESQRFDSTRFKKEHPETYVSYLKPSASWSIRPAGSAGE